MFDNSQQHTGQSAVEQQAAEDAQNNMMETEMSPDVNGENNISLRLKNIFGSVLRSETVIQVFGPYVAAATQSRFEKTKIKR